MLFTCASQEGHLAVLVFTYGKWETWYNGHLGHEFLIRYDGKAILAPLCNVSNTMNKYRF